MADSRSQAQEAQKTQEEGKRTGEMENWNRLQRAWQQSWEGKGEAIRRKQVEEWAFVPASERDKYLEEKRKLEEKNREIIRQGGTPPSSIEEDTGMLGLKLPHEDKLYQLMVKNPKTGKMESTNVYMDVHVDKTNGTYKAEFVPPLKNKAEEYAYYKEIGLNQVVLGMPADDREETSQYIADNIKDRLRLADKMGLSVRIEEKLENHLRRYQPEKWQEIEILKGVLEENRLQRDMLLKTDTEAHAIGHYIANIQNKSLDIATDIAGKTGDEKAAAVDSVLEKDLKTLMQNNESATIEMKEIEHAFNGLLREKVKDKNGKETGEFGDVLSGEDLAKKLSNPVPVQGLKTWKTKLADLILRRSEELKHPDEAAKSIEERFKVMKANVDELAKAKEQKATEALGQLKTLKEGLTEDIKELNRQIKELQTVISPADKQAKLTALDADNKINTLNLAVTDADNKINAFEAENANPATTANKRADNQDKMNALVKEKAENQVKIDTLKEQKKNIESVPTTESEKEANQDKIEEKSQQVKKLQSQIGEIKKSEERFNKDLGESDKIRKRFGDPDPAKPGDRNILANVVAEAKVNAKKASDAREVVRGQPQVRI